MTSVIAVADHDDLGLKRVVRQLQDSGHSVGWLPLGHRDVDYRLDIDPFRLSIEGGKFALGDEVLRGARLVLFRRWRQRRLPPVVSTLENADYRPFAEREWAAAIDLLLLRAEREQAHLRWAERPSLLSITRSRLALLDHAAAAGLPVPRWRVLTDLADLAGEQDALVVKSVDRDERIDDERRLSTAAVDPASLAQAAEAPPTPAHLQLRLERVCEYRAYHVFGTVLALAQHTGDSEIDIRHVEPAKLDVREATLPSELLGSIRRFCDRLGLGICAFDLIRDRDRIWLVDVTPNGSWDHYETDADPWLSAKIAAAIAAATSP